MALFTEHSARLVADAARRQAGYRGHRALRAYGLERAIQFAQDAIL